MSRAVRKQLFEALDTLKKATHLLRGIIEEGGTDELLEMLTDCQECAIAIGTRIDSIYGEGTESVHLLEKYCENIYDLSEAVGENEQKKKYKDLTKKIATIRETMETELKDTLEVVFLPYNVTMWDSLESIWLAAKEDENCISYVIPIPYYDKKEDGSLGEEHYDGNDYPEYIPVTDYQEYDFELRQPDIIFIHNPYDGGNRVTSVHPFFYSKNLKQYTDTLVYVPYFVMAGNWLGENLMLTTGVVYADYVIVQTEREKEYYVNCFKRHYPQFNVVDKFLPLGSPKFDKIHQLRKDCVKIPDTWIEKIQNRKVILYNTGISTFLYYGERYLKKMENVFARFKGQRDVVLLWRPHPLMEMAAASKNQKFLERYLQIKNSFLEEGSGIYDDMQDMYPAIALSDMYYGDHSSIVWLYFKTKKKLQVQNVDVMDEVVHYDVSKSQENVIQNQENVEENYGKRIYETIRSKI